LYFSFELKYLITAFCYYFLILLQKSNVHVNNCLDSPLKFSAAKEVFNNISSLPLEPFSDNAETPFLQNTLFSKDSTNILDVEKSENDDKLVIIEKQNRFENRPRSRKECPWYKKLPGNVYKIAFLNNFLYMVN
jgi:hypothetical protein